MSEDTKGKKANSDKDGEGQVIQFPLERLKAQRRAKRLADKSERQKKATLFLSVGFLLVLVSYVNQAQQGSDLQNLVQKEGMERMVANAQLNADEQRERNTELADSLRESSKRSPASYGRRPSALEKLQFERLQGRYRIVQREGFITEIVLDQSGGIKQSPIHIDESDRFLLSYKNFIAPSYSAIEALGTRTDQGHRFETFKLLSENGEPVGQVEFHYEPGGALIQMKVQEDRLNF